ncbi:cytochrome P450 family protein [Saccharothrix texasensis]|uniref:Cytochrome P450 n=1 Tax=Saccharothrix texasensis TaxID=103734 RepID=A0A3N1GZX0_9PSEU|nr:cytochrome P450 [Saccharothrix texasensis]ROP35850.1 cytochrome P450 [Saccharothrix texasensis]
MTSHTSHPVIDTTGRDIHGESERLRALGRAVRVELPGGVIAWWVTDHALIKQLLTDRRVSRDTYQHWPAWENGESELAQTWSLSMWVAKRNMISAYGAEHGRLRKLVAKAFTARRTQAMRPRIEASTAELLAGLAEVPAGEVVDLRERFAYPLPVQMISGLLGVPDEIRGPLLTAVHEVMDTSATPDQVMANALEVDRLLHELVAVKRTRPGDDVTTGLLQAQNDDGGQMSEEELVATIMLMFTAGHETTVNLFDQTISLLLTHPAQRAAALAGTVPWEDVIEESLRLEAPITNLPLRYAVEDIDLGDAFIPKGDPIVIAFAAGGRDPKAHGDTATEFDPTRPTRRDHLAFGHGTHHCLGAPLARLEAAVGLPALFTRFPRMRLAVPAGELRPLGSFISNGHAALPVVLTPNDEGTP